MRFHWSEYIKSFSYTVCPLKTKVLFTYTFHEKGAKARNKHITKFSTGSRTLHNFFESFRCKTFIRWAWRNITETNKGFFAGLAMQDSIQDSRTIFKNTFCPKIYFSQATVCWILQFWQHPVTLLTCHCGITPHLLIYLLGSSTGAEPITVLLAG